MRLCTMLHMIWLKNNLKKYITSDIKKADSQKNCQLSFLFIITLLLFLLFSCKNTEAVVIWTDCPEFAAYAEIYNARNETKVLAVYKENLLESFPPTSDEKQPDIIVGSWLESLNLKKYFLPLDYLLSEYQLGKDRFYSKLFSIGYFDEKQYLLPVSFNLPCVMFSSEIDIEIPNNYMLSLEEIKTLSKDFNKVNKSNIYTKMGFAPSWNSEFLYTAIKLNDVHFYETDGEISWDEEFLDEAIQYLRKWTTENNTDTTSESDFMFKYLYTPEYKWITDENVLFAYSTSDELFSNAEEKLEKIDFRWLQQDNLIPFEDEVISMGIYKKSSNMKNAEHFITWFLSEENQKIILEEMKNKNYVSYKFGIAGGFSSLKSINETTFSSFYPKLLGNMPPEENLHEVSPLPSKWQSLKERVVEVYLQDAVDTTKENPSVSMDSLIAEWKKQHY